MEEEQGACEGSAPCGDCRAARSTRSPTGRTVKTMAVTYHALPSPRWEGSSIVYDFQYFAEWAAVAKGAVA